MAIYALNDEKMFSDIADGIAVIINSETGIYYGMNALGTMIFERLVDGSSTEDILATVNKLNNVPADFPDRLNEFVSIMLNKGILKPGTGSGKEAVLESSLVYGEEFVLNITEYDDAQELLLADPIHEVKEDTGWAPDKASLETDKELVKNKEAKMEE